MEFSELITYRGSIRGYKSDPVEDEKLSAVLEAARMAPSAHNNQPYRLILIKTKGREEELSRIYGRPWFTQAPLVVCIVGVPSEGWIRRDGKNYYEVDVAIAMDHLILEAHNLGLGTCWVGAFYEERVKQILEIPESVWIVELLTLGYPSENPAPRLRKPLEEIVFYESWKS